MTWITADERFFPDLAPVFEEYGSEKSEELFKEAVSGINIGLYTSGHAFLKKSKGLSNPFEQIASSFVGQWIYWEGWYANNDYQITHDSRKKHNSKVSFKWDKFTKDFQLEAQTFLTGSKDPDINKPAETHYKLGMHPQLLGSSNKDWNSYFPWSQHQFRPPQGSIGQVMQVMLQPFMVTQLLKRKGQSYQGLNTRRETDKDRGWEDYEASYYDVIITANVEWYRVPENDGRLKKPTPFRRKYFDKKTTDEPEKTVYGNVCWCGTLYKKSNNHWEIDNHPAHEYLFDGFRVWNERKNNLYIGNRGFSLSTPLKQTQIINHVWKPTDK